MRHVRFHDLRYTAATLLLAKGIYPEIVNQMLGHSTSTLTLDINSLLVPVLHGQATAAMDEVLSV